jgi:isopropylmalate/homocitrate/citramalate synthase
MFESQSIKVGGMTSDVSEENTNKNAASRGIIADAVKESIVGRYASLDNKIEAVLESVKKQRTEIKTIDSRYPFIQFLSENKRNEFTALNEAEKKRVQNALNASPAFDEEKIVKVWESALTSVEVNEKWLTAMPVEYIALWESASAEIKDRTTRQAKMFRLETDYQIKNFWQTRGFGKPSEDNTVINESKRADLARESNSLGYSNEYVKNIAGRL